MNDKTIMSIRKQNFYQNILNGTSWLLYGIFHFFENSFCRILSIICLLVAIFSTLMFLFHKKENDDEMSIQNRHYARSITFSILLMGIAIIGLFSLLLKNIVIDFKYCYPFLIGISAMLEGILFFLAERSGA